MSGKIAYRITRSTRIRRAIVLKVYEVGLIQSTELSRAIDAEGLASLNGHRGALLRAGIFERDLLARGKADFEPEPGTLGQVQQCIVDALPASKGILIRDALNQFAEHVSFSDIYRAYRNLCRDQIIVRNLLRLTPLGLSVAARIKKGEPGEPTEMADPGKDTVHLWKSETEAIRHQCKHVEIHPVRFRTTAEKDHVMEMLAGGPCPKCLDNFP